MGTHKGSVEHYQDTIQKGEITCHCETLIKKNNRLTEFLGGRDSYNFSSGIYSDTTEEILYKYIKLTLSLNNYGK